MWRNLYWSLWGLLQIYCWMCQWKNFENRLQGRGDGPKAGTSGANEAARAKPGARTEGLLLVDIPIQLLETHVTNKPRDQTNPVLPYYNWEKPAQWDRRNRPRLRAWADQKQPESRHRRPRAIPPLYLKKFLFAFSRIFQNFFNFFGQSGPVWARAVVQWSSSRPW